MQADYIGGGDTLVEELSTHRERYDAIVVDCAALPSDSAAVYRNLEEQAVVTLAEHRHIDFAKKLLEKYEARILIKDSEGSYLHLLAATLRTVLKEKDRRLSTSESINVALRRQEELLQTIPDIVYKLDPDGRFVYINRAVESLGYSPQELIGSHFTTILMPEERTRVSRRAQLKRLSGTKTGPEGTPLLFDERRSSARKTQGLEVRLRRKPQNKNSEEPAVGSIIAYGEISATGQYTRERQEKIFTGTVGIIRDITHRKKSESLLHLFSTILEQSPAGICIINKDGIPVYVNPYFARLHGIRYDRLEATSMREVWDRAFPEAPDFDTVTAEVQEHGQWEEEIPCSSCSSCEKADFWCLVTVYPTVTFGETTHYVLLENNITEKKQWEQRLQEELEENRILLKEVHHRVKNNLTIISSLLNMQANQNAGPEEMAELLSSSQNRIYTMALVHETLYNSGSFRYIDLASYMQSIISELTSIYATEKVIDVQLEVEDAYFDLNRAIPCGLILNELLTNAFKHAFSDRREGRVCISYSCHTHESDLLVVEDNGKGLPKEFDPESSDSLGMQLIFSLTHQLGGRITCSGTQGTRVELLLPRECE